MIFTEALYVVFILSMANFGETQRLNTFDNSTDKRVQSMIQKRILQKIVPFIEGRMKAEYASKFLLPMLESYATVGPIKIAQYNPPPIPSSSYPMKTLQYSTINKYDRKLMRKQRGVYMIWCETEMGIYYPVYVGMTGKNFGKRISKHKSNGVLSEIKEKNWENDLCKDFLFFGSGMKPATANVIETSFLYEFDFPLNTLHNFETRRLERDTFRFHKEYVNQRLFKTLKANQDDLNNEINKLKNVIMR